MFAVVRIFVFALLCPHSLPAMDFAAAAVAGDRLPRLHSLLVNQHGELALERYFHGTRPSGYANTKSASKSVISALVGIAIDHKLIGGVDAPLAAFFPEAVGAKRNITVGDLLTMRSGLVETNRGYGAWVTSPNWVRYLLTRPTQFAPGEDMNYNTGNTHLLSAILTKVAGTSTWDFLQKNLAAPLGISVPRWPRDPQGIYFGGNDMLMTPRQMLRFGELYLHHGRWNGQQVVPAAWVEQSLVPRTQSPISGERYGYGWWIREFAGHQTNFAWGYGGQYIFVVPDLDAVIVTTSSVALGNDRREYRRELFEVIENQVIPVLAGATSQPLPAGPQSGAGSGRSIAW